MSLFMLPRGVHLNPSEVLKRLDGASLRELLGYYKESGNKVGIRRMESLSKMVVDLGGVLSKSLATSKDARFTFSYTLRRRVYYVSRGERLASEYELDIEHSVWVRTSSGLLVVLDSPSRRISRALCQLVSLRLFNDPEAITPLRLERRHVEAIEKWVVAKEHEVAGNIIRVTFRRASLDGSVIEEVSLRKEGLDTTEIYPKLKSSAHAIISLTFVTPLLPEIGRRVTCRIDNRGGVLVYTPSIRDVDLEVLVGRLEEVLGLKVA